MRVATAFALSCMAVVPSVALADNPIVQTSYTADPAPMVYDGRLYVYTTHDEDVTVNNFFTMNDWRIYSTADMVNWTDHGSPLSYKSFSWGTGDAWAGQCIPRNGKFYFYVPMNNSTGTKIGVAVGDSPIGPFKDALGKALLSGSGYIDPTVFIDDDGQAYLYWGNPDLYYAKLNTDMISVSGSATKVNLTTAGFGVRSKTDRATAYEEGPWFYKRNSLYYIVYPADSTPEKISYTTSSGPTGPWTFGGDIMDKESGTGSSFTNHPGIAEFKGKSYFFYHNGALPGGGGYKRSVCVEEFTYGANGSIPTIKMTTTGPAPVANLNPFERTEAETIAFSAGLKTETCSDAGGGMNVTSISNGDYIKVRSVDFGTGATSFEARVAAAAAGGSMELHLDSASGTSVGTCAIAATGGSTTWATQTCAVSGATGLHDLFMKFTGSGSGDLFKFNWWRFISKDPLPDGGASDAGARDTASGDSASGTDGIIAGSGGAAGTGGGGGGAGTSAATGGAAGGTVAAGSGGAKNGGASGTGGVKASGGTSGSSVAGGAGGAGGVGGTTSSSGGAGSGGSRTGSGGASSTGGSSATSSTTSSDPGGCSCQSSPGHGNGFLAFGLLGLAALVRRRVLRSR
jgi:arabinoxylan arabinofuranohydrolase